MLTMKLKLQLMQIVFAILLITKLSAQDLYTGVWRAGTDGYYLYGGLTWSAFVSKWQTLGSQNQRLIDISTYVKNGTRYYNGVWRAGTDGYALYNGLNWTDFVAKWKELGKQNLRLIDIETYISGGVRVYIGVWRAGTDGYYLYGGLTWNNFVSKWQTLGGQNQRLIDVASYVENGTRLYTGVWRAGSDSYALYNGLDWGSFTARWQQLAAQNLRLINISSYVQNNTRLYLGVWRSGTDAYALWNGTDWESTTSKWAELGAANLRLINLETYESGCDATCLNHVLMPDDSNTNYRDTYNYHITSGKYHCEGNPNNCPVPVAGGYVNYRWPNLQIGTNYYARNSVLFGAKDQIFTLPFKDAASSMGHNGWRYDNGTWHHAIDYYRTDGKTFQVTAAAPGKVIYIGWDNWSGNTMVISHSAGGKQDAYRTIYMHLQNGPLHDCDAAWSLTVPTLKDENGAYIKTNYKYYLNHTGCPADKTQRNPDAAHWGKESQKIDQSLLNTTVTAGQVIGWAGSTGPGGCGCTDGTTNTNTHLHIFFAYKDSADKNWYFFDPYGIYSEPYCYPTGVNEKINGQCSRYPVAWKNGNPQYPVTGTLTSDSAAAPESVSAHAATPDKLIVSPNPSVGNITVKYTNSFSGKINLIVYDKTGQPVFKKVDNAIAGDNSYHFNLSNLFSGVYYIEISNGYNIVRNSFIVSK